jgi:hypothetical protein
MKIKYLISTSPLQRGFVIQPSQKWMLVILLLASFCRVGAQTGLYTNVHYNDSRTVVILPNLSQTQRPGDNTATTNTIKFCSDVNFLFISSSTTKNKVNHDYSIYLQFSLAAIPEGAIVDTVDLMVYLNGVKNTSSVFEQGVNLYELGSSKGSQVIDIADSSSSAMSLVSKDDIARAVHLQPDVTDGANWVAKRKGNLYCVLAAEEAETYQYYSELSGDRSKQPKLVIKYHMPANQTRKSSWPQYKYDAQHTGMLTWQSNAAATGFKIKDVFSPAGANYISSDPTLCDDKLVFAYQSSVPPMYRLRSLSQQGNLLAETSTADTIGLVKYGPVADRGSNIYCITGNVANTLAVLSANKLQVIFRKALENNAQATALPVIGFDGSLYLTTNKGIYAYTPQPECKLKWIYTAGKNKFGTIALDEDEESVYVYDGDGGNMTALSNIDGVKKWAAAGMATFETDIPVPAVKNGQVYLTNGLRRGDQFYTINASNGNMLNTISATGPVISQPVIGVKQVYIINNGQLEAYSLSDGTKQPNTGPTGLNAASALVMDANSNVYALNTEQGKQSLTMVPFSSTTFSVLNIEDAKGYLTGNRMLLSPQGSLWAGNNNHLYCFNPAGFTVKEAINIPFNNANDFNSEFLYRSEGAIKVAGKTITGQQNVVIHSGSSIGFQPNFSVKLGATLTCKTGY